MRLSSSLQDLPTYSKADPENGENLETDRSRIHPKLIRALQREGIASSFSKEKSLPTSSSPLKKWTRRIVGLAAIILLILLIFVGSRYYSSSLSHEASKYSVILDCGSTGTRVYVYEWSISHSDLPIVLRSLPKDLPEISKSRSGRAYRRMETEPGFDKLVRNESGLRSAIKPLIKWAEKQIPNHSHKSSSVFLYATAGVRNLPKSDSDWLLDKARSILKDSSFSCQRDSVKIITGMEEAYYGWIALNYHMGRLGSSPAKETFGSLDLGGSSLQVTFEAENPVHDETGINLSIGAVNHHLSAYSLSGYGLNDAFDKSVVHLLKKTSESVLNGGKIELRHPCLQTGYKEEYICSQCALLDQERSPTIGGRTTSKGKSGVAVKLLGAPHWDECSALAKTTVNFSEWSSVSSGVDCDVRPCALSENLPRPRGRFYAMSGFYVVFKFFNLTSKAALDDVLQMGRTFCGNTWEVAKNSVAPQPFIEQYCFRAPYIASLLRDGLHITDDQVVIGSGSITWTLGVALLEAGKVLSSGKIELDEYGILHTGMNPATLLVLLLLSIIILLFAVLCVSKWMPRSFRRPYLPLFRHNRSTVSVSPFNFQRRSPINSGDGKVKPPMCPPVPFSDQQHPFSTAYGSGGVGVQLIESSLHPLGVSHSYSSGSLGQMQLWGPHWGQTLQSRRSQSREDLASTLAEAHMVKT